MRRFAHSILIILATAALAACGGGATTSPASNPSVVVPSAAAGGSTGAGPSAAGGAACATAAAGATAATTVTIKDFKFSPSPVQAKVGDTVAWKNDDSAPHSATMDDGSCDTDSIAAGSTAMLTFTAAGTYTYHCKVHPTQMKDVTVVVQ